jgi:hypothetical protein
MAAHVKFATLLDKKTPTSNSSLVNDMMLMSEAKDFRGLFKIVVNVVGLTFLAPEIRNQIHPFRLREVSHE